MIIEAAKCLYDHTQRNYLNGQNQSQKEDAVALTAGISTDDVGVTVGVGVAVAGQGMMVGM